MTRPDPHASYREHVSSEAEAVEETSVPVQGIRLRKEGVYTIVDAEIGGAWIEAIRERSDGEFCHIVEPSGMLAAYYKMPASAS